MKETQKTKPISASYLPRCVTKDLSKYKNIALLAMFVVVVILIRLFWYPVLQEKTSKLEKHNQDVRRITISNIKLEIPRSFLIGSSASKEDGDDTALLLAFTYPELKAGLGDGKDYVSLWFEDWREYKKLGQEVYTKWTEEQNFPKKEYNRFNELILKRKEMIKERFDGKIPFSLSYIQPDNALMCDSELSISNPKCEYAFIYKDLYILIIFKAEDLDKTEHIKQSVLKLIKQWSNTNERIHKE